MITDQELAINDIRDERVRQDLKFGIQNHSDPYWLAILTEEIGKAAEDVVKIPAGLSTTSHLRKELIQVAAVTLAWVEAMDGPPF